MVTWWTGGAIALAVVVILVIVLLGVTGPSSSNPTTAPTPAAASVVNAVEDVPTATSDTVGTGTSSVTAPQVSKSNPPLTINNLPGVVFVGGEFCPYCAAERWSLVLAFSRFGEWSNLDFTQSSVGDVYPSTNTFTFRSAAYTSSYLAFDFSEHWDVNRNVLMPLNSVEQGTFNKYGVNQGVPFLDIGNKFLVTTPSYSPQVLQGLDWQQIAAKLTNPSDPVTLGIVGTANYITAAICNVASHPPARVCSQAGVQKAASAMGVSA